MLPFVHYVECRVMLVSTNGSELPFSSAVQCRVCALMTENMKNLTSFSDPTNIPLHMKKCRLLERVGEKKKSLDGYQAVLKLLPDNEGEKYMQMARDLAKGYHDLGRNFTLWH